MNKKSIAVLLFGSAITLSNVGSAQNPASPAAPSGQAAVAAVPVMVLRGTLNKGLNSKSAPVGQTFVVKTTEPLKLSDGTSVPADSDITGHVLEAAARANGAPESRLTLTFDTLQAKGADKPLAIRGIIQAIAGPSATSVAPAAGDMRNESLGGGVTGARISSDQLHSDAAVGRGGESELNEHSVGVVGIKNMTLKAGPVNGVDGNVFYSADKSVKLDDGSRVMLRIALKQ
ncbi:MAG: hypothetical protein ACJ71N_06240 [Terriglobales bacterium]